MSFISSSYDEGEIVIPTVSETEHRLVQDLYDNVKGNKHMNNDLISREALRNSLLDSRPDNIEQSDINFDTCDIKIWLSFVLKTIDNAPTAGPRIEYGTDGQPYKLSISNGKEFERPQGDLKSGEALKAYARKVMYEKNATNFSLIRMFDEIIDNAPTFPQYQPDEYKCPECGYESTHEYRYCPDCGKQLVDDNYRRYPGWDKVENMRKSQKGEDK